MDNNSQKNKFKINVTYLNNLKLEFKINPQEFISSVNKHNKQRNLVLQGSHLFNNNLFLIAFEILCLLAKSLKQVIK